MFINYLQLVYILFTDRVLTSDSECGIIALLHTKGEETMEFDNGTFDIDIYCNMCDSNKYELEYDAEENCVIVTCSDCGNIDRLYFDK